jgi:hypothetical protein
MLYLIIALSVIVGLYFLFRDTMNRIQYVQTLRVYWITRNNTPVTTPRVCKAFMRQTAEPWWYGKGVQLRYKNYSFQIGVLISKSSSLLDQVGGRELEHDAKEIRKWTADRNQQGDRPGISSQG